MKFRIFLTSLALLLCVSLSAQATERAKNRAKNRAENRANSKVDREVDKAVDEAFNAIGGLFKKKNKNKDTGAADGAEPGESPATTDPATFSMGNSGPWEPYTNPVSFSLTMEIVETKKNGKVSEHTMKMAVVPDRFGIHMFSDQAKEGDSRMILNTQDGKTTMITKNKKGEQSAFRLRVPQMRKAVQEAAGDLSERFTFEKTAERRTIDGYPCVKYVITDTEEGTVTESWVTTALNFNAQDVYRSFAGLAGSGKGKGMNSSSLAGAYEGFPLESTTTDDGTTIKMSYRDIKVGEDKMDKALLDVSGIQVMDMGF